jgi:hypothetical protein
MAAILVPHPRVCECADPSAALWIAAMGPGLAESVNDV